MNTVNNNMSWVNAQWAMHLLGQVACHDDACPDGDPKWSVIVEAQPQEDRLSESMFPQSPQIAVEECLPAKGVGPEETFDGKIMAPKLAPVSEHVCDGIRARRSDRKCGAGKHEEKANSQCGHGPNENKMSDGGRGGASRAAEVATINLDRTAARCSLHRMVRCGGF